MHPHPSLPLLSRSPCLCSPGGAPLEGLKAVHGDGLPENAEQIPWGRWKVALLPPLSRAGKWEAECTILISLGICADSNILGSSCLNRWLEPPGRQLRMTFC